MKNFFVFMIFLLSGCVIMNDDRFQKVDRFPIVEAKNRKSVTIFIDSHYYSGLSNYYNEDKQREFLERDKKIMQERFVKSGLYKNVYTSYSKNSDYTVSIKANNKFISSYQDRISCMIGPMVTGFTFMIIPTFCEYPTIQSQRVEIIDNSTNKIHSFLYEYGMSMGYGILTLPIALFYFDNVGQIFVSQSKRIEADNLALRVYQMIESIEASGYKNRKVI